jgi:hypothetical protein
MMQRDGAAIDGQCIDIDGRPVEPRFDNLDFSVTQRRMGQRSYGNHVARRVGEILNQVDAACAHLGLHHGDGVMNVAGDITDLEEDAESACGAHDMSACPTAGPDTALAPYCRRQRTPQGRRPYMESGPWLPIPPDR